MKCCWHCRFKFCLYWINAKNRPIYQKKIRVSSVLSYFLGAILLLYFLLWMFLFVWLMTVTFVGESPSSSASDIDNLNNNGLSKKAPSNKDANSPQVAGNHLLLAVRNQPHLTRLLAYVSSFILTSSSIKFSFIVVF